VINRICLPFFCAYLAARAGEAITSLDGVSFIPVPPVCFLLDQELTETTSTTTDGVIKKSAHLDQALFGIACSVDDENLTLYPVDIQVKLDTPTSGTICSFASYDEIIGLG